MTSNEMIAKIERKGGRRWTKGNMDRLYIDMSKVNAWSENNADIRLYGWMNRYEIQDGRIWYDVATGEFRTRGIRHEGEVVKLVEAYFDA